MLTKIISGGQTGADRAALDFAIEFDIPHGGWIPKGRKTEDGVLPEKYKLQEMPTASYPKRTVQNVIDSDGTLILSHGKLTGGSAFTKEMAEKHGKPCLHVDLNYMSGFIASEKINLWIADNKIRALNVAGSRASKDPKIYDETFRTLKTVYLLGTITDNLDDTPQRTGAGVPQTVEQAVERLISGLTLKDSVMIAKMPDYDLDAYHTTLGLFIRNNFGLAMGNEPLMDSCRAVSGNDDISEDEAATIIITKLWEELNRTHTLRAVK